MSVSSRFDPRLLAEWSGGEWIPAAPERIGGITHDTRAIRPDDLFVAVKGARFDGHTFVAEARRSGACGAVVRRDAAAGLAATGPLLVVEEPVAALQAIAAGYRRQSGATVIGVTGSVGKTTVKDLIAGMLATTWRTARTRGNWNNEIGLPLSLLAMGPGTQTGVFELGISHPGEMAPLCRIAQPDWGVITAIGPVHLEFFASVEAIAREKGELLRSLSPGGTAVLSLDDPCFPVLRELVPGRLVTVSMTAEADYRLEPCGTSDIVIVRERSTGTTFSFRMPMPGQHNRHNVLLATAVARGFNVPWPALASALEQYTPPPMRWETREAHGVTLINDAYNANPLSMKAALDTFRSMPVNGRKWLVLGDMLELGEQTTEKHAAVGRSLAGGGWAGLLAVGPLGARLADGAEEVGCGGMDVVRCATAGEAGGLLAERVKAGDAVLFKASRGLHLEDAVAELVTRLAARA